MLTEKTAAVTETTNAGDLNVPASVPDASSVSAPAVPTEAVEGAVGDVGDAGVAVAQVMSFSYPSDVYGHRQFWILDPILSYDGWIGLRFLLRNHLKQIVRDVKIFEDNVFKRSENKTVIKQCFLADFTTGSMNLPYPVSR